MMANPQTREFFANPEFGANMQNLLPIPFIEAADVTEAMIYLCGQSGRYITGVTLPVDAGIVVK